MTSPPGVGEGLQWSCPWPHPADVHPSGTGLRGKAGDQRLRDPEGKSAGEGKPAVCPLLGDRMGLASGPAPRNPARPGLSLPHPGQPPPAPGLSHEATTHPGPASCPGEASRGGASNTVRASAGWHTPRGPRRLPPGVVLASRWTLHVLVPPGAHPQGHPQLEFSRPAQDTPASATCFSRPSSPDSVTAPASSWRRSPRPSPCLTLNPSHGPGIRPHHVSSHAGSVVTMTPRTANPQDLQSLRSTFC